MRGVDTFGQLGRRLPPWASLSLVFFLPPAIAQQASQPALQEITVTAERVAVSAQSAPYALTVLSASELESLGATQFIDYAGAVPSLAYTQLAPGDDVITLRGVQSEVNVGLRSNLQKTTGVYLNDVALANNYQTPDLDLYDITRVEVLKGPQGTLYGDGAVGGLIRLISNQPNLERVAGSAEATYGFLPGGGSAPSIAGMLNVPLVDQSLGLRVVAQYKHEDGWIDNVGPLNKNGVNAFNERGARALLKWQASENLALTLTALTQSQGVGSSNDYQANIGDLKRYTTFPEPITGKFDLYDATLDWNLGWANLTSSSSYTKAFRLEQGDLTAQISELFGGVVIASGLPQLAVDYPSFGTLLRHSDQVSEEVRLVSSGHGRFHWIAGASYTRFREEAHETDSTPGFEAVVAEGGFAALGFPTGFVVAGTPYDAGPGVIFDDPQRTTREEEALYGEATWAFTDALAGTLGLRYYHDTESDQETATSILFPGTSPFSDSNAASDNGVVFRARVQDQLSANLLTYALISQGFRSGGLNPLNPASAGDPTFPRQFSPDRLVNYELGWKSRAWDRRLTLNGSLFYIDWRRMQMTVTLPDQFSATVNARSAIRGFEWELMCQPVGWLDFGLSGSLLDARLREAVNTSPPGSSGDQLLGSPKFQGYIYGQLHFPIPVGGRGFIRADAQGVSAEQQFFGDHNDPVSGQPGTYGNYVLYNLRAGGQWARTNVALFVKNLANRRAVLFRNSFESPISTDPLANRDQTFVAEPRIVGLTVSQEF